MSVVPPDSRPDPQGSLGPSSHGSAPAHKVKPVLRGVSHQLGFLGAIPLLLWLIRSTPTVEAARYVMIYGASLLALLGVSAAYHRITWKKAARLRMKRLDHSVIFLLIAGTYTPICMLGIRGMRGPILCATIWAGAG